MAVSRFRPCIDLHEGKVKQIVGGTLRDEGEEVRENFVSEKGAGEFATLFRENELTGGHVIKLGPGNEEAAREALSAWPGGLQIGGGVTLENACAWIKAGASHVIITSALFNKEGVFQPEILSALSQEVGRDRLVLDLSCKRVGEDWVVAMNRWQTLTDLSLNAETLDSLYEQCDEFLIHAADVEGLCGGMDAPLVEWLGKWSADKKEGVLTYAGGISSMDEISLIQEMSEGHVDYTVGSALDLFGGRLLKFEDLL